MTSSREGVLGEGKSPKYSVMSVAARGFLDGNSIADGSSSESIDNCLQTSQTISTDIQKEET